MPIAMSTPEPDTTVAVSQARAAQSHAIASTPG